jgi:hypothetical protein
MFIRSFSIPGKPTPSIDNRPSFQSNYTLASNNNNSTDLAYWNSGDLNFLHGTKIIKSIKCDDEPSSIVSCFIQEPGTKVTRPAIFGSINDQILIDSTQTNGIDFTSAITLDPVLSCSKEENQCWQDGKVALAKDKSGKILQNRLRREIKRSLKAEYFIGLDSESSRTAFLKLPGAWDCHARPTITCMKSMARDQFAENTLVVLGLAENMIQILDPSNEFKSLKSIELPSPPILLSIHGTLLRGFRVYTACVNDCIYCWDGSTLKRIYETPEVFEIEALPNGGLFVATISSIMELSDYGKVKYSVSIPETVTSTCAISYPSKNFYGRIVATGDSRISVYNGVDLIHSEKTSDSVDV